MAKLQLDLTKAGLVKFSMLLGRAGIAEELIPTILECAEVAARAAKPEGLHLANIMPPKSDVASPSSVKSWNVIFPDGRRSTINLGPAIFFRLKFVQAHEPTRYNNLMQAVMKIMDSTDKGKSRAVRAYLASELDDVGKATSEAGLTKAMLEAQDA